MKAFNQLSGEEMRCLIISAMMEAGIKQKYIRNALKIRFPQKPKILGTSLKIVKGEKLKILTSIAYLSPEKESIPFGGKNFCAMASVGCAKSCLGVHSRRLKISTGLNSKLWKSLLWTWRKDIFRALLERDVRNHEKRAELKGFKSAIRPNGCTDVPWEIVLPSIFEMFPSTQFYDYTKIEHRFKSLPPNYHLTFSRSEDNEEACLRVLKQGHNVAIVFKDLPKAIKTGWKGFPVFNADETDYRPGDEFGIAGLSIKSKVKVENSNGFIVEN